MMNRKFVSRFFVFVLIFILLALLTSIAMLIWYFVTCSSNSCPTTISSTSSETITTLSSFSSSSSTMTMKTTSTTTSKKRNYRETCENIDDCHTDFGLLCQYGWEQRKTCLCEGSHYWSIQQNKCLRKGEINDSCETDYQCHREIGLICEQPAGTSKKICICAATLYWAKESNCGQLRLRRIIDCTRENHGTTCLVMATDNLYHMLTIRSVTEKEISFDWFLVDNRLLSDLPQLSCAYNNETKYCFGLSVEDPQHSLKLAQFTRKGFHSVANLGGSNMGRAFGLTDVNRVAAFVRQSQNRLYRRIIADDEVLAAHDVATSVTGDTMCYVHQLTTNRPTFCFARNSARGLSEFVEISTNTWRATQLGSINERIRDESVPVCNYVGSIYRYCFVILENNRIYRLVSKSGVWSSWQTIDPNHPYQFIASPLFFTSQPFPSMTTNQTCFLVAIDTNFYLQLSKNQNCAQSDSFTDWTTLSPTIQFKQMDQVVFLRDGNIGLFGVDHQNQPLFIYFDRTTNQFTVPRPTLSLKPEQFRP